MENNLNFGVLHKSWGRAYAALHRHGQRPRLITLTDLFGHYLTVSAEKEAADDILHIQIAVILMCLYVFYILVFFFFFFFLPGLFF